MVIILEPSILIEDNTICDHCGSSFEENANGLRKKDWNISTKWKTYCTSQQLYQKQVHKDDIQISGTRKTHKTKGLTKSALLNQTRTTIDNKHLYTSTQGIVQSNTPHTKQEVQLPPRRRRTRWRVDSFWIL